MSAPAPLECVLFDLDGTLVDTAPDFVEVIATLTEELRRPPVPARRIRESVSEGARALVKLAFAIDEQQPDFDALHQRLLDAYYDVLQRTGAQLYPGMGDLLGTLDASGVRWGIVTNKPEKYARRLLERLNLLTRCKALVCPEHVQRRKPDPEAILLACQKLDCDPQRTACIGDHPRDIQAASNAGVIAIAAAWGYLAADAKVENWGADFILDSAQQTGDLLQTLRFHPRHLQPRRA